MGKLTKAETKRLNEIYADYALTRENIFIGSDGYKIINRAGIGIIKRLLMAEIEYRLVHQEGNYVTVHGIGYAQAQITPQVIVGLRVEDFGEASPMNNSFMFPVAVAKKRCESRIVLELAGLYDEGFRGEDEMGHNPKAEKQKTNKQSNAAIDETLKHINDPNRRG